MPRKTKVLTKTLYCYVKPETRKFAIAEAKRLDTPGGYSGWVEDLITKARQRSSKKETGRAGHSK